MRLPKFEYREPRTLKEASRMLASDPKGSVLLAGGTDLLVNMKHRLIQPRFLVNLKRIPKLAYISEGRQGFKIGALTPVHEIASSSVLQEKLPALCQAANDVGAYAHRVMGTVGGNLCQSNRCRYFNQAAFWRDVRPLCYKTGGKSCYIVRKPGQCHSTYCGDLAPLLIALDSHVTVSSTDGERTFPLKSLYTQNGKKPLSLKSGEILKEVFIPRPFGEAFYLKMRKRDSLEFPLVSLALCVNESKTSLKSVRILFSGIGCGPVEVVRTEKMLRAGPLDEQTAERVSTHATKEVSPLRTSLVPPAFKRRMAGILLRQALEQMMYKRQMTGTPSPLSSTEQDSKPQTV